MAGDSLRPLGSLDHAWLLGDESVTAFQRPPRGGLGRLGESVLNSWVQCPPASPQSPPRGYSRAVSWYGRLNHQVEPHAPGVPLSGRCAAGCLCGAPPTMGLSAQPPDSTPAEALGLPMVLHHSTGVRDGCVSLQLVYCGRTRPARLVAAGPLEPLCGHRKGHLAARIRRLFGPFKGGRLH